MKNHDATKERNGTERNGAFELEPSLRSKESADLLLLQGLENDEDEDEESSPQTSAELKTD